jgi:heat shock protein HslJ
MPLRSPSRTAGTPAARALPAIRCAPLLACIVLASACSSTSLAPPPALIGTQWRVERLDGKGVPDRSRSTLQFSDSAAAGGVLACNRFTASYTQDGAYLKFGEVASTRMACPQPVMEQEARFSAVLEATRGVRRDGNALLLVDAAGNERARLTPAK